MAFARELDIALSPDVHAPRRVRALLEAEFADLGDALYTAQVIASELVTNAILHGEPPLRFEARGSESGVRLAVYDQRGDVGRPTPASRGLEIVGHAVGGLGHDPDGHGQVLLGRSRSTRS